MIELQRDRIIGAPGDLLRIALPLTLCFVIRYFLSCAIARRAGAALRMRGRAASVAVSR
jgi:ACR3 family arsenite efflux pump ArsB